MYQRNAIDPEEQARRQALSRVLTSNGPDVPMNAKEPIASGGPVRMPSPDTAYDAGMGGGGARTRDNAGTTGGMTKQLEPSPGLADLTGGNTGITGGMTKQIEPASLDGATPKVPGYDPASDHSAWDTDGYSAPQFTPPMPGADVRLNGFDFHKMQDPNNQHPKYVWSRIAAANTQDGKLDVATAVQQLQQAYPGTTFDGKDGVDIPGVGKIDLLQGASSGQNTPQWLTEEEANGSAKGPGEVGGPLTMYDNGGVAHSAPADTGDSTYAKLLAMLQQQMGGGLDQQALERVLGGK